MPTELGRLLLGVLIPYARSQQNKNVATQTTMAESQMTMIRAFREIELFVAAYEERSFTAAALRENATQSGVSQHVGKLECSLRVDLFIRDRGKIFPTPAADALYSHSVQLLRHRSAAERSVQAYAKGLSGEIIVGLMTALSRHVLASTIVDFQQSFPNVGIRVVEGFSAFLTQQIQAGQIDFAVLPALNPMPGLVSRTLFRTPEVFVRTRTSAADGAAGGLADSDGLRLIVPSTLNTRRKAIEFHLASRNIAIERLIELDSVMGTLSLIAEGGWSSILPGILFKEDDLSQFRLDPINDPPFELDIAVVEQARRGPTFVTQSFLNTLVAHCHKVNTLWQMPHTHRCLTSALVGPNRMI